MWGVAHALDGAREAEGALAQLAQLRALQEGAAAVRGGHHQLPLLGELEACECMHI